MILKYFIFYSDLTKKNKQEKFKKKIVVFKFLNTVKWPATFLKLYTVFNKSYFNCIFIYFSFYFCGSEIVAIMIGLQRVGNYI